MKLELFKKLSVQHCKLSENEQKMLQKYIKEGIVKCNDGICHLNSIYRIGEIAMDKYHGKLLQENDLENLDIAFADLNGAKEADIVLIRRIVNPKAQYRAKVIEILKHSSHPTLVYFLDGCFYLVSHPEAKVFCQFSQKFKNYDLLEIDPSNSTILKELGNISDPKTDEYISMFLYNEEYRLDGFSQIEVADSEDNRKDLTHLPFCTIDPPTAKDHDDAIYYDVNTKTLYVGIADVSHFVKENTLLDMEASKRSTSIYLPHKVHPMLPAILSEQVCSLRPNEKKYAFVFEMVMDEAKLEVASSKLYTAMIISKAKFSYDEIDELIKGNIDESAHEIFPSLTNYYRLSAKLRKNRLKKGFDFDTEELRLVLDGDFLLKDIQIERGSPSHALVEEAMLLANTEAAKLLKNKGIFRNHDKPSLKAVDKLLTELQLLGIKVSQSADIHKLISEVQQKIKHLPYKQEINDLLIKTQQLAVYSPINIGHFGLGFTAYSHFTSPIRRYADLVLHRILKTKKIPKDIEAICEHINKVERKANELVWDFEDRKFARWCDVNRDQVLEIMVVDVQRGYARTLAPLSGMKVVIDSYGGGELFERMKVRIYNVNLISKQIVVQKV